MVVELLVQVVSKFNFGGQVWVIHSSAQSLILVLYPQIAWGTIWDAKNQTLVSHVHCKHSTHSMMTPNFLKTYQIISKYTIYISFRNGILVSP